MPSATATMMTVSIRPARPSDAGEIAQLTTQLGYDLKNADAADRLSRILARGTGRGGCQPEGMPVAPV
jgi:hypothetical protein